MIELMIILLVISVFFEAAAHICTGWLRKGVTIVTLPLIAFVSGGLFMARFDVATALIGVIGLYRCFNLLRIIEARMNIAYLHRATQQTSAWLVALQAIVGGCWYLDSRYHVAPKWFLWGVLAVQLCMAVMLLCSLLRHLRTTKIRASAATFADRDLPTVTVAIPARNEDEQLEACLRAVVASNYPKLEVIVLDDCSQDRTPEIIRGFAHDGIRFVLGEEPRPTWLAKNQAYDQLVKEASGDLLLFCGVDMRYDPTTIRDLVTDMLTRQKVMVSVMPLNEQRSASMPQTMRYLWELALPRRMFNRPPVLSSCWIVYRHELKKLGGFAAVSRSITPEAFFARELIKRDGYSFLRSNDGIGLTSVKGVSEQRNTAVRTRYPQLHRRPEIVCLVTLIAQTVLLAPFVLAIVGIWGVLGLVPEVIAIVVALILLLVYRIVEFAAFPRNPWIALPIMPFALLSDLVLLHYSMWKYEFSEVVWKGRNVCIPTMHVIPHLPKM